MNASGERRAGGAHNVLSAAIAELFTLDAGSTNSDHARNNRLRLIHCLAGRPNERTAGRPAGRAA